MREQFLFFAGGPLPAIPHLHQQGHDAARRSQFTKNPASLATLGRNQLLPPGGECFGIGADFGHAQATLASVVFSACQPRQTKIPRLAQRQARFGRITTTAATAVPTTAG